MECPFCAEEIKDEALVCKCCGRDLKIPKPLIEENQELTATIGELRLEVEHLKAELARRKAPGAFWATHLAIYIVPPIMLLLVAHVFLIVKFAHLGWRMAAGVGVVIGIIAVAGMTTIIGYTDNVPIMPQNIREWRETIEYAASIALATLTGNILATMARNILPKHVAGSRQPSAMAMRIAMLIDPHASKQALRRRSEKIDGLIKTTGSVGAAVGSAAGTVYTGVRALMAI